MSTRTKGDCLEAVLDIVRESGQGGDPVQESKILAGRLRAMDAGELWDAHILLVGLAQMTSMAFMESVRAHTKGPDNGNAGS